MAAALGATLKVKMDTSEVSKGVTGIRSRFARLRGSMRSLGSGLRRSMVPVVGVLGGIGAAAVKAANSGAELRNEMERTGQSAKEVLKLREAFRLSGVEADKTGDIVTDMQERLEDARTGSGTAGEGLGRLGIALNEIIHLDPAAQMDLIMDRVNRSALRSQEIAFSLDKIFGGAGMELVGLAKNYEQTMADAERSTKNLAASIEGSTLDDIRKMQVAMGSVRAELARAGFELIKALPIDKLADAIAAIDWVGLGKTIKEFVDAPFAFTAKLQAKVADLGLAFGKAAAEGFRDFIEEKVKGKAEGAVNRGAEGLMRLQPIPILPVIRGLAPSGNMKSEAKQDRTNMLLEEMKRLMKIGGVKFA